MNRCITCQFYDLGKCRRSPPATRIFPDFEVFDHRVVSCWPEVTEEDWCGEHRQLAFPRNPDPDAFNTPSSVGY